MRGEADQADLAGLPGFLKCLHGAARAQDGVHVLKFRHGVQLVEVKVIRPQPG